MVRRGRQVWRVAHCPHLLLPAKEAGPYPVDESAVLASSFLRETDLTPFFAFPTEGLRSDHVQKDSLFP